MRFLMKIRFARGGSLLWLFMPLMSLFAACDMIEYHPYDVSLTQKYSDINKNSIEQIVASKGVCGGDTIRFILMGDTQRYYDDTRDFVRAVNRRSDVDFVIHGGDISDFGMTKEFVWIHEIMKKMKVPYVALLGNHDILGNGEKVYRRMYGDYNFSFVLRGTKFLFLNTNALEFDYATPVPDFEFIKQEQKHTEQPYEQTIVAMHVPPFDLEFNNNVAYYFQSELKQFKNPLLCLHAHVHALVEKDYFDDGLMYYGCDFIHRRNYMLFTIAKGYYSYEVVYF